MRGFCRSCSRWKESVALKSVGWCAKRRDMVESLNTCDAYVPRPISFKNRAEGNLGVLWERFGAPIFDAATSSRKTLEMMIVMAMMMAAFFIMLVKVYPTLKDVMLERLMP